MAQEFNKQISNWLEPRNAKGQTSKQAAQCKIVARILGDCSLVDINWPVATMGSFTVFFP